MYVIQQKWYYLKVWYYITLNKHDPNITKHQHHWTSKHHLTLQYHSLGWLWRNKMIFGLCVIILNYGDFLLTQTAEHSNMLLSSRPKNHDSSFLACENILLYIYKSVTSFLPLYERFILHSYLLDSAIYFTLWIW